MIAPSIGLMPKRQDAVAGALKFTSLKGGTR